MDETPVVAEETAAAKFSGSNIAMRWPPARWAGSFPAAGHVLLRRTGRGMILFLCINGLFWAGVAVGGVLTVNPLQERWWGMAQYGAGGSGLYSWYRQHRVREMIGEKYNLGMAPPPQTYTVRDGRQVLSEQDAKGQTGYLQLERGVAAAANSEQIALVYPADVVAQAFSGVAGMLNVMCASTRSCWPCWAGWARPLPAQGGRGVIALDFYRPMLLGQRPHLAAAAAVRDRGPDVQDAARQAAGRSAPAGAGVVPVYDCGAGGT